ncbi:MAG: MFS transporter [Nevskiaceae bacterium]|jgi:MFS family permease|nr:MFS transporter [Nevskiaceae bacterium]
MTTQRNTRYQWLLIGILSANFGVVFFDRNAFAFLTPFIQPDMQLSNTQIGLIAASFAFAWAIAGLFMGSLSDRFGRRKMILVVATLVFSLASVLSGVAGTFIALLGARMLMGIAEGGIMPITQTLIAAEVDPKRRGLAHGITQNFGANVLANFLGPIVIVAMANAVGWRHAFWLVALPGFLMAALIALFVREPTHLDRHEKPTWARAAALLTDRTILVCIVMSVFLVPYLVIFSVFTPLYLVQVKNIDTQTMSWIMSSFGLASIAIAFLVPGLSDRLGRKPVAIVASLLGVFIPLGVVLIDSTSMWPYCFAIAAGASISGVFPLAMATVPSEIVRPGLTATALSLTMGISEIIGGVLAPSLAGKAADTWGLSAPQWIIFGLAIATSVAALLLRETAPRVLAQRQAVAAQ